MPVLTLPSEITASWSTSLFGITLSQDTANTYSSNAVPDFYQTSTGTTAYTTPEALSSGSGTQSRSQAINRIIT